MKLDPRRFARFPPSSPRSRLIMPSVSVGDFCSFRPRFNYRWVRLMKRDQMVSNCRKKIRRLLIKRFWYSYFPRLFDILFFSPAEFLFLTAVAWFLRAFPIVSWLELCCLALPRFSSRSDSRHVITR